MSRIESKYLNVDMIYCQVLLISNDTEWAFKIKQSVLELGICVHIKTFIEGKEAIEKTRREHDIHIVLLDEDQNTQESIELLASAYHSMPLTKRILVSQTNHTKRLIEALNRGRISKYISKHQTAQEIGVTLQEVYKAQQKSLQREFSNSMLYSKRQIIDLTKRLEQLEKKMKSEWMLVDQSRTFIVQMNCLLPQLLEHAEYLQQAIHSQDYVAVEMASQKIYSSTQKLNTSYSQLVGK